MGSFRRLVVLLTLVNVLNYLDRFLVAGTLTSIQDTLGINNQYAGWLFSAFVPGYVIFSPIFGYLGDRMSRPKLMALGALLWSVASIATALAPNFWVFLVARVVIGIGEASFGTIAPGYLKDTFQDPLKLNSGLALFYAAIPVGTALSYVIGGYFATHFTWQSAFLLAGVPGIFLAAFVVRFPEVRKETSPPQSIRSSLQAVSGQLILWFVIGGYILNSFSLTGIAAFVTKYGENIGFSKGAIGAWFGAILFFSGGIGTFGGGRLATRFAQGSKQPIKVLLGFAGISALIGAVTVFGAFSSNNHWCFLGLSALAELMIFAGMAPINSIIVLSCPPNLVTFTQGVTILLLNLFGALPAPVIVGIVADNYSLPLGLQLLSVILLGSGIVWILGTRRCPTNQGD